MTRFIRMLTQLRHYPFILSSIAVGAIALTLLVFDMTTVAYWIVSLFAAAMATRQVIAMARAFKSGAWGVDALAIVAISATLLTGELVAAIIILVMLTGGEALQSYAERRARDELRALLERAPAVGHLIVGGIPRDVPVSQLCVDDVVEVQPGETVPVDGSLLDDGTFDESSITGESVPVDHSAGATVLSGAVNGESTVRVRATATAAHSQLATIIDLVQAAADSRAPFVRLADRFALPFTLVALTIGGLAWLFSGEAVRFAEVLVVATPCPLLIAAPVAFIGGTNRAARAGITVKSGGVLEVLARVATVALDKTGTLTEGKPAVVRTQAGPHGADPVIWAAAIESHSTHLLADAIVAHANALGRQVPKAADVHEEPGHGAAGTVEGHTVRVGRVEFVASAVHDAIESDLEPGETAVYVAVDGSYAGRVVLEDEVRPNAQLTMRRLRELGIRHLMMLTGDGMATAASVARRTGITEVRASLLPRQKVDAVRAATHPVLMVGDGVNDAPVLAAADIGIAMGARGATAASESADVVIMLDDLGKVPEVILIARRTVSIALQSVWVGIGVSVLLMVVAAFGVLPAVLGAILQEGLDVAVILNGLRARHAAGGAFGGESAETRNPLDLTSPTVSQHPATAATGSGRARRRSL
jgi:heavy metal translocating P-type ATPase